MDKSRLLQKLIDQGQTFHFYSALVSDSDEQRLIKSAQELEKDGSIVLEICRATTIDTVPMVELKGHFPQ
jgi:hypothetical protein